MLRKIKQTSIVLITLFYLVQFSLSFSGSIIDWVQEIRHQNQISKINAITQKTISLKDWKQLNNKKEIKINQHYFDIHSYTIVLDKVVLSVVQDDFESEVLVGLQNLFLKTGLSSKKHSKALKGIPFFATIQPFEKIKLKFISLFNKRGVDAIRCIGETQNIVFLIDRPPICFIF